MKTFSVLIPPPQPRVPLGVTDKPHTVDVYPRGTITTIKIAGPVTTQESLPWLKSPMGRKLHFWALHTAAGGPAPHHVGLCTAAPVSS